MTKEKENQEFQELPGKISITQPLHRELFKLIRHDAKKKGVSMQTIITLKLNESYGII